MSLYESMEVFSTIVEIGVKIVWALNPQSRRLFLRPFWGNRSCIRVALWFLAAECHRACVRLFVVFTCVCGQK